MKIRIRHGEEYPVWSIDATEKDEDWNYLPIGKEVDISEETLKKWIKIQEDYNGMQDEMSVLENEPY